MKKIMDRLAHSQWRGGSRFTNILKFISTNGPIVPLTLYLIKSYQMILSPWLGARCRFHPSCSNYAMDAIEKQGVFVGMLNIFKRLAKCHPFHSGGYDPVANVESK